MKRTRFSLFFAAASLIGAVAVGLVSFKDVQKAQPLSTIETDDQGYCNGKPAGFEDGYFTTLSTDFASHNFSAGIFPTHVNFDLLNLCWWNSGTPSWYTYMYLGILDPGLRPSGTRTFTGYNAGNPSQTVSFTLYSTGALYMQQTGGATMARNIGITSATYTK